MTNPISPATLALTLAWICLGICAICTMEAAILQPMALLGTWIQQLFVRTGLYLFLLTIGPIGYLAIVYVVLDEAVKPVNSNQISKERV